MYPYNWNQSSHGIIIDHFSRSSELADSIFCMLHDTYSGKVFVLQNVRSNKLNKPTNVRLKILTTTSPQILENLQRKLLKARIAFV